MKPAFPPLQALCTGILLAFLPTVELAAVPPAASPAATEPRLIVYPAPTGVPANSHYTVKARTPGGEWHEVFCHAARVDMHHPRTAAVAIFDFTGEVEVAVTNHRGPVASARIRPLSYELEAEIAGDTVRFRLDRPRNLSIEINGDIFENLHLFAGAPETDIPDPESPDVIYFGPGVHSPGSDLKIPSGKTVYLAGGAVLNAKLVCDRVENVRIRGRGIVNRTSRGVEIKHSRNVSIEGITLLNPRYYSIYGGQSTGLTITNLKSFSYQGWSDGIDLMSCTDVLIDGVFMRNSDDCIAIYGHRWDYSGDSRNITVRNSTLWADVAHPVNIGTHGSPAKPEIIENLLFANLDILNHDEPQIGYQGCFAINVSDANLVRDVTVEDVRIEDFEQGQLVNLRVAFNRKYATAPGRGIENVHFKNITYNGTSAGISIIAGYDDERAIDGVVFENLRINGRLIRNADQARFFVGEHVRNLEFRVTE